VRDYGRGSSSHCIDRVGSNMALVKSSKIGALKAAPIPKPSKPMSLANPAAPAKKVGAATHEALFDRVAVATEEFASGLTEGSAAPEQLRKSMGRIAAGAEEAAGASQEQLAAIKQIFDGFRTARGETDALRRRTENVQILLGDTAERITASARAIRGAFGDDPGADQRRRPNHGGRSTNRSRFATTGLRHPGNFGGAPPDRERRQARTEDKRRLDRAGFADGGGAQGEPRRCRATGRRCRRRARRHANQPIDDFVFGNGRPPYRKDCRRYRLNGGADEHAHSEWVGRGRARRRSGTGFRRRLE
jgi:hypothetical protein